MTAEPTDLFARDSPKMYMNLKGVLYVWNLGEGWTRATPEAVEHVTGWVPIAQMQLDVYIGNLREAGLTKE